MAAEKFYHELVCECTDKLGRELTGIEAQFIQWIYEKQVESFFQENKSS